MGNKRLAQAGVLSGYFAGFSAGFRLDSGRSQALRGHHRFSVKQMQVPEGDTMQSVGCFRPEGGSGLPRRDWQPANASKSNAPDQPSKQL